MATIDDVARAAEVSRMTVSRVINNKGYVKKETRQRIQEAIDVLKYRPSIIAKTLATRKNRTIAYVMVNISDPFHNLVIQGIESIAYKSQYTTMICDSHSPNRLLDYIDMFSDHCLSGAIFHHLDITAEQVYALESNGTHCVMMDNEEDLDGVSSINTDNYSGAQLAVEYLHSRGHRIIGCVHGLLSPSDEKDVPYEDTFQFKLWEQRTQGYKDAMKLLNLNSILFQSNGRMELAGNFSRSIVAEIKEMKNKPTALYCENDIIAISMINQLQEHGISVPDDIAIIGHDGLDVCKMIHPYITTITQPRFSMGQKAGRMLIDLVEEKGSIQKILLQPSLQIGETV